MATLIPAILLLVACTSVSESKQLNIHQKIPTIGDNSIANNYKLNFVRQVPATNPGVLSFFVKEVKKVKTHTLLISSYSTSISSKDQVQVWERLTNLNTSNPPVALQQDFFWPKEIVQAPDGIFPFDAITIPDGADIVGKQNGRVFLADISDSYEGKYYDLTTPKTKSAKIKSVIQHFGRVTWVDLAGLKLKEHFFVCRHIPEDSRLQLVMYMSPAIGDELRKPWQEIVLKETACDANLALTKFHKQDRKTWEVLYATGKLTKKLVAFWPEDQKGNPGEWTEPGQIKRLVLDSDREFYDVQIADVNKDGVDDVIVTVLGSSKSKNGTVEIWQVDPLNFNDNVGYRRHVVAKDFVPNTKEKDARSPGNVRVFYPDKESEKGKPWLLVAGGDDGRAYYLVPKSNDKNNWDYDKVRKGQALVVGGRR